MLCIGEIIGGADRLDRTLFEKTGNGLIANFGQEEWRDVGIIFARTSRYITDMHGQKYIHPKDLGNWHVYVPKMKLLVLLER